MSSRRRGPKRSAEGTGFIGFFGASNRTSYQALADTGNSGPEHHDHPSLPCDCTE